MRIALTLVLSLALVAPAVAAPPAPDVPRPLPRPAAVERTAAFAGATELAPRAVARPRHGPAAAMPAGSAAAADPGPAALEQATALAPRVVMRPRPGPAAQGPVLASPDLPAPLATAPARPEGMARLSPGRSGPAMAPDPVPDPARLLGPTRSVTLSASNAMVPVFVTSTLALPRPARRPDAAAPQEAAAAGAVLRPRNRPETITQASFAIAPRLPTASAAAAVVTSPRPVARPRGLAARAAPPRITPVPPAPEQVTPAAAAPRIDPGRALVVPKKGAGICGDPAIEGSALAPITSRVQGCGIAAPVRVTAVDGVRLSTPATLDCPTARALRQWVTTGLKPAAGKAGVSEIRVAAHYVCRPRNNIKGARVSEHGRGKAIDIAGIRLANGQMLSVLGDYRRAEMLQKVRRAACGIFGTTLGPGSDRHHNDHFHFDTANHRNGPYCR